MENTHDIMDDIQKKVKMLQKQAEKANEKHITLTDVERLKSDVMKVFDDFVNGFRGVQLVRGRADNYTVAMRMNSITEFLAKNPYSVVKDIAVETKLDEQMVSVYLKKLIVRGDVKSYTKTDEKIVNLVGDPNRLKEIHFAAKFYNLTGGIEPTTAKTKGDVELGAGFISSSDAKRLKELSKQTKEDRKVLEESAK